MKKLNIVLAATGISSKALDVHLTEVSHKLRKKGHRVWLIRVNPKKVKKYDLPVYWSGPKWKISWLAHFLCPYFQDRVISQAVKKAIEELNERVDIVDFEIPSFTYCYEKRRSEKLIVKAWYYPHQLLPRLKIMFGVGPKKLYKKLIFMLRQAWYYWGDEYGFRKADTLIALTPKLTSQLVKKGLKVTWIPFCLEVKDYQKREAKKPVRFGCVVYDLENPRKGIKYLLESLKMIEKMNLPVNSYRVELVGGYTEKLEKEIEKRGLKEKIKLLGRLKHNQVLVRLQQWDVFVFPSLFEELSMATIEVMAAGLVCLGWKIDALEAAWGDSAILLPKGNVELLTKTMAKLINNPKLRKKNGQKAWRRAKKYFDTEVVVNKLEKVYLETLSGK